MYKFKSIDKFEVKGRGTIFVVISQIVYQLKVGDIVEIDEKEHKLIGIETLMSGRAGLLVKEEL